MDGFWECPITVPELAERGTWRLTRLQVSDRVGNGAIDEDLSLFTPDGTGQLCRPDGNCVAAPTVEVTNLGDDEAPFLQSLSLNVVDATATVTLEVTDDLSGANFVEVEFESASTTQFKVCFGSMTAGTSTDGTWECSITFQEFNARGEWFLSFLMLVDVSGNRRLYRRRAADGFLCYPAPTGDVCQDFGDTVIIVL